jgi:hypothetical protein
MALIKNGVTEEVAWSLSPVERLARLVVFGEMNGGEFSWRTLSWRERKA